MYKGFYAQMFIYYYWHLCMQVHNKTAWAVFNK